MRLISVNVGRPKVLADYRGRTVLSAIAKEPVSGPVAVKKLNIEGDSQADLSVHGGEEKAVYVYPSEHYQYWKERFPERVLPWGSFGENLTTEGLMENEIRLEDRLVIGTAQFEVTQPRFPCFKLGLKFNTQKFVKAFLNSDRTGFYLKVLKEGRLRAGDVIVLEKTRNSSETITSIVRSVNESETD